MMTREEAHDFLFGEGPRVLIGHQGYGKEWLERYMDRMQSVVQTKKETIK